MAAVTGTTIRLPARVGRLVWFVDHWSPATVRPPGPAGGGRPDGRGPEGLPLGGRPRAPPRGRGARAAGPPPALASPPAPCPAPRRGAGLSRHPAACRGRGSTA